MLTGVLSPAACAACGLCCHFEPASLWECPALEEDCAERLRSLGVPLVGRAEGGETIGLLEASGAPQEGALCPLLDRSSGCRLPREERPLECRLWPLRLMVDESGKVLVCCYDSCPGLASVPEELLLEHARSLLPVLRERVRSFPASVRALHANYRILFAINEGEDALK